MLLPARQPTRKRTDGLHAVTNGGSSTSFARCVRGTQRDSTADRKLRSASTAEQITDLRQIVEEFFLAEEVPVP